ncbi:hypothetical protein ABGB19_10140 [Mycobacterium sp. B14F4]|uniref:hypothetical protein n=1 Tax=Mycobacterium sp. B14F4 TaxID=3153565 RepID=UPI00325E7C7E
MALSWWPVAAVGFGALAAAVALAVLVPVDQRQRRLRRLANTARLTSLPEYARVARMRAVSAVVTIVLLAVLFSAAVLASARPTGWWWSSQSTDIGEDIMLCVGQPVTDPATGEFLAYFAEQARSFGTQRIGLTSPNRRVVPLTRDYQYAVEKFNDAAALAPLPDDAELSAGQAAAKRATIASFAAPVTYVDYAPSVADTLALCMTGFPASDGPDDRRRSLIYLGPGSMRATKETRPSLYSTEQVTEMARRSGIQVNAVASSPGSVRPVVEATGGRYAPLSAGLIGDLDEIRTHPPGADQSSTVTGWRGDSPTIPLTVAVVVSVLLCLSLVVLRR